MEWYLILIIIFACLILLMFTGMPIFVAFMIINVVGIIFYFGVSGLEQLILSINSSLVNMALLPIPMFILMGEVLFRSGIAFQMLNVLDQWMGRLPGRLALLSVGSGTLLSTLTGTSSASTAMLGSLLVPEMEKRQYKKSMSLGPIMAGGLLAPMIPPSSLAVLIGAIGEISIGKILLAIIIPGLLMALAYAVYIIVRCFLQPSLAPAYDITDRPPLSKKIKDTLIYVVPLSTIIFLTIGVILLGIASPTEAATLGTFGAFILAAAFRQLNWNVIKESVISTLKNSGVILIIVAASTTFSQILVFSGATKGLASFAINLEVAPILIIIAMLIVVMIMGCFMSLISIMMITLPIFIPVIDSLGYDKVWFAVLFLIVLELGLLTPPLGINLFVLKGVSPPHITLTDIIKAAIPYIIITLIVVGILIIFPELTLWIPGFMN